MPKRRTTPHPQSSRLRLPRRPSPQRRWRRHRRRLPSSLRAAPPGTEVRLLRRLHRRLARPGRLAEAAPRRYRRHGGHRRVLDCVVRPARSQGVPGSLMDSRTPPPQERHPGRPVDSPPAQPGSARRRASDPTRASACCASYLRQRAGLVTECGRTIQHMQKALEQINVKLTEAVSDITGKTGLSIIQAILAGERDPTRLARRRPPLPAGRRADRAGSARDLEGGAPLRVEAGGRALGDLPPTNHRLRRADPDAPPDAAGSKRRRAAGAPKQPGGKRKANGPRFDGGGRCTG